MSTPAVEWRVPVGRTAVGRRHKAHAFVREGPLLRSRCGGWLLTESSVRAETSDDRRCQYCSGPTEH